MSARIKDTSLKVQAIGEAALDWLASGQDGEVVASVSRTVYLKAGKDELFWIAGKNSPMHRRCLQVSSPIPEMVAGAPVHVRDRRLVLTSRVSLDWKLARVWKAPFLPAEPNIPMGKLAEQVTSFYHHFLELHQPAGLGQLIPAILKNDHNSAKGVVDQGNIILISAWTVVETLLSLLFHHNYRSIPETVSELIGLGEGLTPSGDDFLGGFFFCLNRLQQAYPHELDITSDYSIFLERCKTRTNLISFTLLKDNIHGYGLEPLELFFSALLQGDPFINVQSYAELLVHVGHSTGWDMLTGFLAGMAVTFPASPINSPK
jgi:hypothetical protein